MASYSGHVDSGTSATRVLDGVSITKLSVGPMDNNCYVLVCHQTGDGVLIDAAHDSERIIELLRDCDGLERITAIVTTHRHADHWQALADVAAYTQAKTYAGAADAPAIPVRSAVPLEHGDRIPLGNSELAVIALRGHTPGSIALAYRYDPQGVHLFTGDSLFPGGPGKTASDDDFTSLMNDLEDRVFGLLPDDTWVYPGHGDDTTLGTERPQLAEWRTRGW